MTGDEPGRFAHLDADVRADYYERLYEVTAALSAAELPEDVVSVLFAKGLEVLGADAGFLGLLDDTGEWLHVRHFADYTGAPTNSLEVSTDRKLPIVATALDGKVRLIESNHQLECDFPGLERLDSTDHACASLPLVEGERVRGALNVAFKQPRAFTPTERVLIELMAGHCATALTRAERLRDAEQRLFDQQALAVHDEVVQDLALAKLALEHGQVETATEATTRALESAKGVVVGLTRGRPDYRR